MKYKVFYIDNEYHRKLRKFFGIYCTDFNGNFEGEKIDYSDELQLSGGESLYHESNNTMVVYRIDKSKGTVDEI
jgi:hypothetical protein